MGRSNQQKEIRLLAGRSSAGLIWKYVKDLSATLDFSFPDLARARRFVTSHSSSEKNML